jgi:hypothetical protein
MQAHHTHAQWCWTAPVEVVVGGADLAGVALTQMGYVMSVETSHATPAVAVLQGKPGVRASCLLRPPRPQSPPSAPLFPATPPSPPPSCAVSAAPRRQQAGDLGSVCCAPLATSAITACSSVLSPMMRAGIAQVEVQLTIPVGSSQHCIELPGVYTVQPTGAYRFDREYTFSTTAPDWLTLVPSAVRLMGSVGLPAGVATSTANVTVTATMEVCSLSLLRCPSFLSPPHSSATFSGSGPL